MVQNQALEPGTCGPNNEASIAIVDRRGQLYSLDTESDFNRLITIASVAQDLRCMVPRIPTSSIASVPILCLPTANAVGTLSDSQILQALGDLTD